MTKSTSMPRQDPLYLDWARIQAGDVLLVRTIGVSSTLIAGASGGPYSHAALIVDRQELFESDDEGVGYTFHGIDRAEKHGPDVSEMTALCDISDAIVLRHPLTESTRPNTAEKLRAALRPLVGLEYPSWGALATAARGGKVGKALARAVLRMLDECQGTDVVIPGPFCSELVCGALDDVLPGEACCFEPRRDAASVGPNDFLRSRLTPVRHAVCTADESVRVSQGYVDSVRGSGPVTAEGRWMTRAATANNRLIAEMEARQRKKR